MIQVVLELDLADYSTNQPWHYDAYQFERREREQIEHLVPGSYVRLNVRRYRPYGNPDFFRKDLMWQLIGGDSYALNEWRELLEGAPLAEF